jgi:pimeloyl-ACP methyl ester carboxylesterase
MVKSVGSGDHAVVCLHGWFGSSEGWGYFPEAVDGSRFTYYFPDMRGYGARRDETGDFTMKEYAADALAALDEAGVERFSIVGHSMGGKAAAALLALAGDDRVNAMIGIAPVSPAPFPFDDDGRKLFFDAPEQAGNRRGIIDFTTGNRNGAGWLDAMVAGSLATSTVEAFAGAVASWGDDDYLGDIGTPPTPITCLVGEHDPALSAEYMEAFWVQQYSNVTVETLPACGHYPMHEVPVWLATRIEGILG